MRIETLNKVTLTIAVLGVGSFALAIFGPSDMPSRVQELLLLSGIGVVGLGIVFDVVLRRVLQKKVRAQNDQWLEAFYKRSGAQKKAKKGEHPKSSSEES